MRKIIIAAGMLAIAAVTPNQATAQAADGKTLFADKGCAACHGEDARTTPQGEFPKLAGQNADYMVQQMKDIKTGKRTNGLSADVMKPALDDVSETEMRALADYIAGLGPIAGKGEAGPGKQLYMTKTCSACHGRDGQKPLLKTYPYIAGQNKPYLLQQMNDIKNSVRTNGLTSAMQPVMHLVSDQEIEAIADFLTNVR